MHIISLLLLHHTVCCAVYTAWLLLCAVCQGDRSPSHLLYCLREAVRHLATAHMRSTLHNRCTHAFGTAYCAFWQGALELHCFAACQVPIRLSCTALYCLPGTSTPHSTCATQASHTTHQSQMLYMRWVGVVPHLLVWLAASFSAMTASFLAVTASWCLGVACMAHQQGQRQQLCGGIGSCSNGTL